MNPTENLEQLKKFYEYLNSPKLKKIRFIYLLFLVFPVPMIVGILWLVFGIQPKWAATFFFIMPVISLVIAVWIFKSIYEAKFGQNKTTSHQHHQNQENDHEDIKEAEIIED